jgi:NADH-quinone oxidoreductase subunit F
MMPRIQDIGAFNAVRESGLAKLMPAVPRLTVGMGTCGRGNGAEEVFHALNEAIHRSGLDVMLAGVGCFRLLLSGAAGERPPAGKSPCGAASRAGQRCRAHSGSRFDADHAERSHLLQDRGMGSHYRAPEIRPGLSGYSSLERDPFLQRAKKIVLRNCGLINPSDIEEYIAVGGYQALYKVLIDGRTDSVIEQIKAARLRGRGGAGFLTGNKWDFMAKAKADSKYIICNADEGDPGAYMNRNEIEGDPHSLLEGMIIGAYVMGATEGIIYVRAEYPLAVSRLNRAIEQAREYGMLGANILDRGFNFNIQLVQGAGAFVCGEETA